MMNKKTGFQAVLTAIALLIYISLLSSCSGVSTNEAPTVTPTTTTPTTTSTAPANIALTATPSTLTTGGTSSIQATVTTANGNKVPDGISVTFALSSSAMGTINSSATTNNGIATATFTASTVPGTVTITATSGSVTQTVAIALSAPKIGNIVFDSATPQVIGIIKGGQTATSTVTFKVTDINGNAALDGTQVSFVMKGPSGGKLPANGGEYIGNDVTKPITATASTKGGKASVTLNSGSVAGTVTITASVTDSGQTFSASSAVISIGGGAPSATHFNLASDKLNLAGLAYSNKTANISAYVADRFGNYNVLTGTSVSFYVEAGAIDRSNITDSKGTTTVQLRTQAPNPADVAIDEAVWGETSLVNNLNAAYPPAFLPTDGSVHPRDGWVTVLAVVQGEEAFLDENGNGLFDRSYSTTACPVGYTCECDSGSSVTGPASCAGGSKRSEGFKDIGEPFVDKNDNGTWDNGQTSGAPFEEYIDVNGNNQYDGPNGVWDGPGCTSTNCLASKAIWTSLRIAFTGHAVASYCRIFPTTFNIPNGGSQSFKFMVGDVNTNRLVGGTTIAVTATGGTLSGQTSYTIPDGVPRGPAEISFSLSDPDSTKTQAAPATITVTVTSTEVGGCTATVSGTTN